MNYVKEICAHGKCELCGCEGKTLIIQTRLSTLLQVCVSCARAKKHYLLHLKKCDCCYTWSNSLHVVGAQILCDNCNQNLKKEKVNNDYITYFDSFLSCLFDDNKKKINYQKQEEE